MNKKAATPHDLTSTTTEIKYAQMEILPFVEKYNLPVWFVVVLVSLVALKQLGLIYFVKDIWAGVTDFFTTKSRMIVSLKQKIKDLEDRVANVEDENAELREIVASIRPLLAYIELQGASDLGIKQMLDKINK